MIRPQPRSTSSKYHSLVVYFGLVLFISLSSVRTQASPDPLPYAGREAKPDAGTVNPAQENQQTRRLEPGRPIERELAGDQSHSYQMTLVAAQYVRVVVDQRGIDVVAKLIGPDGKQVTEFDDEIRTQGQETVEWVAEEGSSYRVDVVAKYKNAATGRYEIQVVELRVATDNDRALHEADKLYFQSRRHYFADEYDKAEPLLQHALAIREKALGAGHPNTARALSHLANLYKNKGDYARAEPLLQHALTIREKALGAEHPDTAMALLNLATLYQVKGNYAKAEPAYQRALAIWEKALGPEHPHTAMALINLAVLYQAKGDYTKTEPAYQRALAIRERALGPEHPDTARVLNHLAILYYRKGEYAKAEPAYQRALAIREKAVGPEHPDTAEALLNLAILYYDKGEYAKAETLFQRALAICEKALGPEHPNTARVLLNLATLYKVKGDYAKAEPAYQRALTIREKVVGPEHPDTAMALHNIATLYQEKGDYAKTEPAYQRALAIFEKALGLEHPHTAMALLNLANTYREKGNYAKAESAYQRALAICEKALGPEHPDTARVLNHLANIYREKGDYAKAEPAYQRALAIFEKALGSEHSDTAMALYHPATLYRVKGDYAKAETLFQRALAILEKALGPEHPYAAATLNNLADIYREIGDYTKAETAYQRALAICEKVLEPEHIHTAAALNSLANLYREKGDYAKAEPLHQRALAISEKVLGPEHIAIVESLSSHAKLYAAKGDIAQAFTFQSRANIVAERNFALNLAAGSERQKLAYLDLFSKQTDFTLTLHSQAAPSDPQALELAFTTLLQRKARGLDAMTDTIATLRRHATPEDQTLFDKLKEARSQLAALSLKGPDAANPDNYRTRVEYLAGEVDKLEGELSSRSTVFRSQTNPVTLTAVQAALPADSVLVEFALFTPQGLQTGNGKPPRYLAYLLPSQGQPKWVDLGESALIDRAVELWRKALRNPKRADFNQLARALDEKVMRPVRSLLSRMPADMSRLLIAPDGSLNLIPFAALVDERNQHLIERYSISYLTSGRDLLRLATPQASKGAPLVVANPDFGQSATIAMRGGQTSGKSRGRDRSRSQTDPTQILFQQLPTTEDEALAIKEVLPEATVLKREEATETALKQASRPHILHIATHGFFLNYQEPAQAESAPLHVPSSGTSGPASAHANPYSVQLEATPAIEAANEKVKRLKAQGVDAYIVKSKGKGKGTFFRIRVGNFPTQAAANEYGVDLKKKGIISEFFVVRYQSPQGDLTEPAPAIAGTTKKRADSIQAAAPLTNSRSVSELPFELRLSKFTAQVKDPLLRSGLALAGANHGTSGDEDGILTALEAAYLDLSGTKLVVLSACDTGVGDVRNGEGIQGLRRALILAGSESQVISLWPVSDQATKDLMILYYKALQQGEGRGEALRQVQLRMLRGRTYRQHPVYWAAFIQSGEWANLGGKR
jgi:CHAT domain-containing protein/Tfp pilus assembly protein PilF